MAKKASIVFLVFLTGLAGNLIAAWIQQDLWNNFFSISRLLVTGSFAVILVLLTVWLENKENKSRNRSSLNSLSEIVDEVTEKNINNEYDLFVLHGNIESKDPFIRTLIPLLQERGLRVWFDENELIIGDNIRQSIDNGLAKAKYGLVIISRQLFENPIAKQELYALLMKEYRGNKVILPIWLDVDFEEVIQMSPLLASRYALSVKTMNIYCIAEKIAEVVKN